MSTLDVLAPWIDRVSDWANPILVKETRQALKSRQFITTFMLLLTASWAVSVFGLVMAGDMIEFGSPGGEFFAVFFVVLAVAVLILVPFGAYRSLVSERDENTFELLSITALSPRQIVWGKLLSALLQVFMFYSAIAPFIAFTSLLDGFDLARAVYLLVITMLASLGLSMTALMMSTLARHRQWQAFNSFWVLVGAVFAFSVFLGYVFSDPFAFDDSGFWWKTCLVLLAGASYFVLFHQVTTARLSFEAENRSTGIRVTCSVQFWLLWGGFFSYVWWNGLSLVPWEVLMVAIISAVHWAIVGLLAATEDDILSRRVRRRLPRNLLVRFLLTPLMPGGTRGFLYLVLHLAALWTTVVGLCLWDSGGSVFGPFLWATGAMTKWQDPILLTSGLCCYVLIYVGIATALGRWTRAVWGAVRPAHVRVLTVLLFAAGILVPLIPRAIQLSRWRGYSLIDIANPFVTLYELTRSSQYVTMILIILSITATVALLINVRALQRALAEVLFADGRASTVKEEPVLLTQGEPG